MRATSKRAVRTGEAATLGIMLRKNTLLTQINALNAAIRSTLIWTTPESDEALASEYEKVPDATGRNAMQAAALRAEAQRLRLAILTRGLSPARVQQELAFGKGWQNFYFDWGLVVDKINEGSGSNEQQVEALDSYEAQYNVWKDNYQKLIAQPYSTPAANLVIPPKSKPTSLEGPSRGTQAKFTALWVLGFVGLFGLIRYAGKR